MAYQPIEPYGVIGNLRTAALVGMNGSIDWLCLPHFDSPSVFTAILDEGKGGRFQIAPCLDEVRIRSLAHGSRVMCDNQKRRAPFLVQSPQEREDVIGGLRVEIAGRFIGQHEFGGQDQRAGRACTIQAAPPRLIPSLLT